MAGGWERAGVDSADLVRLMAPRVGLGTAVGGAAAGGAAGSGAALSARMAAWLGWSDAIALSRVLGSADVPAGAADAAPPDPARLALALCRADEERARLDERLRADTAEALAALRRDMGSVTGPRAAATVRVDLGACRRLVTARQRALETAVAALRARLRATLALLGPALARLAALDAALEPALAARERVLLAGTPGLLESGWAAALQAPAEGPADPADRLIDELAALLDAEQALRLEPLDGLIEALRDTAGGA
jgi:hypothetical protein